MKALRIVIALSLLLCLLAASLSAVAAEPPKEPILRIETGLHTAMIKGMATDAAGRWLVTASDDKTVRVWDLAASGDPAATGPGAALARVLRPPIGPGNEGKLFAVALSPDGASVACGGWTGWDLNRSASLYIFDRASGRLARRVDGFPDVIKALAFSRDGRRIAVGLGGGKGVYSVGSADGRILAADSDYDGDCYGLDFDRSGRLVSASWDGFIRLYDRDLKLVAKGKAPGGERPYMAAFSPDGGKIAVGCEDARKVSVLSGQDLSPLYIPPGGADGGSLFCVAWSADGALLYAAGTHRDDRRFLVRRWEEQGRGGYSDLPAADGNVMALVALPSGGVAFAALGPGVGVVDARGAAPWRLSSPVQQHQGSVLLVSGDAARLAWGGAGPGPRLTFDLADAALQTAPDSAPLQAPVTELPELRVTGWRNGKQPQLAGRELELEAHETARVLALAADGSGALLGTDWYLHFYDPGGLELWRVAAPGIVWAVNVAPNGKVAVAAFGDGTIRWYRLSDGRELVALFPHADRKRWVLWTPGGYYSASVGGEELAGWHRNDAAGADFFPLARFRAVYCRPDVIGRVLAAADEEKALKLADRAAGRESQPRSLAALLPPVVEISAPPDRSSVSGREALVAFSVRSPSGEPVTGLRVLVNGRPVSFREEPPGERGGSRSVVVALPEGESEIAVIAQNRHAASVPATVRLLRKSAQAAPEVISFLPRLFILAVGVGAYPNPDLTLEFAAKDARDFTSLMLRQKGALYGEVSVKLLADGAATREAVLDGLRWLRQAAGERDTALLFLSGHGVTEASGAYYFLPVDGDTAQLGSSAVVFSQIRDTLMSLPGKAVLFVDTCHAGAVLGRLVAAGDVNAVVNELSSAENGVVVFASSTGKQSSLEDEAWGNGAFTKALVEGVAGKADYTGKGKITVTSLDLWLSERVQELTDGRQTPTTAKPRTIADFPLALKK